MVSIDMGEIPKEEEKFYLVTSEDEKAGAEMSEYLISNGTKKSYIWQMPFMELTIVDIRE